MSPSSQEEPTLGEFGTLGFRASSRVLGFGKESFGFGSRALRVLGMRV